MTGFLQVVVSYPIWWYIYCEETTYAESYNACHITHTLLTHYSIHHFTVELGIYLGDITLHYAPLYHCSAWVRSWIHYFTWYLCAKHKAGENCTKFTTVCIIFGLVLNCEVEMRLDFLFRIYSMYFFMSWRESQLTKWSRMIALNYIISSLLHPNSWHGLVFCQRLFAPMFNMRHKGKLNGTR